MKKLNALLAFLFLFFCLQNHLHAQGYITAGGVRIGDGIGFTLQQRVLDRWTAEGILNYQFSKNEAVITGLLERHIPLISRRLNCYIGGGVHAGLNNENAPEFKNPFGVTAITGVELSIDNINISVDIKPAVNLTGGQNLVYLHKAISVRYIFIKDNKLEKFQRKRKKKKRQKARKKRKKKQG